MGEKIRSAPPSSRTKLDDIATQRIKSFRQRHGEAHLYLAYHAAFPLALTPDLLYCLWANFQRDTHSQVLGIPWIAVADLLLSNLCEEVGYELYELDTNVRNALLRELQEHPRFGRKRIIELSGFLLDYVRQRLYSDDPDIRDFAQSQKWTALAYTRPSSVASELASALSRWEQEDNLELIRIASIVETFAEPLAEFKPLLVYARGMASFARGDLKGAAAQLSEVVEPEYPLEVAGVNLPIPEQIIQTIETATEQIPEETTEQIIEKVEEVQESVDAPAPQLDENRNELNLRKFFQACNPSRTLVAGNAEDRQYYIDFSSARGGQIIEELKESITFFSPDEPTCQLFTGHIGCGKSTELFRLKAELEQEGFHVVYFESSQDMEMADVDISDILLAIARRVSESLEAIQIKLKPVYFTTLFAEIADFLQTPIELSSQSELSLGIAKITAKTKDSPKLRSQLRNYLEPRTNGILDSMNQEVLKRAVERLKQQGKKGLVVIVDNLDRIDSSSKPWGRPQPEYLFVDRGEQLRNLNCHVVYTIPLTLTFSNDYGSLINRFGLEPKVLPMVPVQLRDGSDCKEGMALLREMVLARAFPRLAPHERLSLITEVYDSRETLDRLCRVSGGHLRNLLRLLHRCIQKERQLPISRQSLEYVIQENRNQLTLGITDNVWDLLRQVAQQKTVRGEAGYQVLVRSLYVFEYRDREGSWFDINPILAEARALKA